MAAPHPPVQYTTLFFQSTNHVRFDTFIIAHETDGVNTTYYIIEDFNGGGSYIAACCSGSSPEPSSFIGLEICNCNADKKGSLQKLRSAANLFVVYIRYSFSSFSVASTPFLWLRS